MWSLKSYTVFQIYKIQAATNFWTFIDLYPPFFHWGLWPKNIVKKNQAEAVMLDNLKPWEVIWEDFKHYLSIFKSTVQYISLALQRPGRKDAECELEESIGGRGAEGWRGLA